MGERAIKEPKSPSARKLVYTQAPVTLGRLVEPTDVGWRVAIGGAERELAVDECVDPALLEEAFVSGARVVIDNSEAPAIVGVIATQRALVVDRDGDVRAKVRNFVVDSREELLLKTRGAFIRARAAEVEVYGTRLIHRARDLAKIMGAMIKLN